MAQYTQTATTPDGMIVNVVLDTNTNTSTYTVTAPNGAVATNTQSSDLSGSTSSNMTALRSQLSASGYPNAGSLQLLQAVRDTTRTVKTQAEEAQAEAEVFGTSPPAEKQPIPASTLSDPQVPQPENVTAEEKVSAEAPAETTSPYGEQNDPPEVAATTDPEPVPPDENDALRAAAEEADATVAEHNQTVDDQDPFEAARQAAEDAYNAEEPQAYEAKDLGIEEDSWLSQKFGDAQSYFNRETLKSEDAQNAASEAAFREKAKQQATIQSRYKQPGNGDWRVRLSLAPGSQYLYNAGTPPGSGAGILKPLADTNGVIFPYTPSITTTYSANYEQYDLVHSNYRGLFYKNSRVGDISIRGTFTAQDTNEADYLLAVIHFFRSVTKMFYGQDAERGTPPPVCFLNGLGSYQFSNHPVVVSSFNYTTPPDVDYIRAVNPNNYGINLLNRRNPVASNPGGSSLAGLNRLLNAVQNGLSKGALPNIPAPGSVTQSVNNTADATYVPTKMEIDITLIPVQTRTQVSKQFSLKNFANGQGLKGGLW